MTMHAGVVNAGRSRRHGERAAARHGVARVDGEIHDDVLEVARVGEHGWQILRTLAQQLDVLAQGPAQHDFQGRNLIVQIHWPGLDCLFAAERQQLAGERRRAGGSKRDLFQGLGRSLVGFPAYQHQLHMALDYGQNVVEIVGDPGGQLSNRLHLLTLVQLILQFAAFRDVFEDEQDTGFGADVHQLGPQQRVPDRSRFGAAGITQVMHRLGFPELVAHA